MSDQFPGEKLAQDFQISHESKMTRETRPRAASDILRDRLFIEKHIQLHKQGWSKATVINFHTFPLVINTGYTGYMTVPARKPGEPYAKYVIDKYRLDARDLGDARYIPEPVMPSDFANDFMREYGETTGGVLAYTGDRDPSTEELELALETQTKYFWKEYNTGRDIWASRHRHDLISERQRDAARALFERGLVEKPDWMDRRSEKEDRKEFECEACGKVLRKGAKFCTDCNFVFDVQWVLSHRSQLPKEIVEIALQAGGPPVEDKPVMGVVSEPLRVEQPKVERGAPPKAPKPNETK